MRVGWLVRAYYTEVIGFFYIRPSIGNSYHDLGKFPNACKKNVNICRYINICMCVGYVCVGWLGVWDVVKWEH